MEKPRKLLFSTTLADCRVETFCSGGPGGQHQNKTRSAVRITHRESGAVGESRELKSQHQNRKIAWERMCQTKTFQAWARTKAAKMMGEKSPQDLAEEALTDAKVRTEVKDEQGRWKETDPKNLQDEGGQS